MNHNHPDPKAIIAAVKSLRKNITFEATARQRCEALVRAIESQSHA